MQKYHSNLKIQEFPELREISWGKYDGSKREGEVLEKVLAVGKAWEEGRLEESLEYGESPFDAEVRSVNKLYEIISASASDPKCQSIVLILHGRLLRVMLSSIMHRDLTKMALFPHHNTTVNIVDAIISPDAATSCVEKKELPYSRATHDDRVEFKGVLFDSSDHLVGDACPL